MEVNTVTKEYVIDAEGKKLGRIASQVAMILRGKNSADFKPNAVSGNKVTIKNAAKVSLTPFKMGEEYTRYSGYPGGLTREKRDHMIARKGYKEVFEKAVYGMLPNNRLRARIMKNLTITE